MDGHYCDGAEIVIHFSDGSIGRIIGADDPSDVPGIASFNMNLPHATSTVVCQCGRKWEAVYPPEAVSLECPGCGSHVGTDGLI
jgi:hypothetical protein